MTTDETLNELLVRLFKDIMEIEARCLVNEEFKDISYNDFHIIEAIGLKEPKSMTAVAKLMDVTTGTLTKAMDGLTEGVCRKRTQQAGQTRGVGVLDGQRKSGICASRRVSPQNDRQHQGTAE